MTPRPDRHAVRTVALALAVGLAVAAVALLLAPPAAGPSRASPPAQAVNLIAVDTNPSGNSATSLATTDSCRELPTGGFEVDVIVDRVPAGRDLAGLQFVIRFDSAKLQFDGANMDFILSSGGGSPLPPKGNPQDMGADPGDVDKEIWFFGAVRFGGDPLTNVAGVGARLSFTALTGGATAIEILPNSPVNPAFETKAINIDNTLITINELVGGTIAISPGTCQQAPPPPVHTPATTTTPTSDETPGPGTTPQATPPSTPLPPATATAVAAESTATAEATTTAGAETPGPGTPTTDGNGEGPSANGDDDDGSPIIYIILGVLAALAVTGGAAWLIRQRLRTPTGPGDGE